MVTRGGEVLRKAKASNLFEKKFTIATLKHLKTKNIWTQVFSGWNNPSCTSLPLTLGISYEGAKPAFRDALLAAFRLQSSGAGGWVRAGSELAGGDLHASCWVEKLFFFLLELDFVVFCGKKVIVDYSGLLFSHVFAGCSGSLIYSTENYQMKMIDRCDFNLGHSWGPHRGFRAVQLASLPQYSQYVLVLCLMEKRS